MKSWLITGASSGLGLLMARKLLARGIRSWRAFAAHSRWTNCTRYGERLTVLF